MDNKKKIASLGAAIVVGAAGYGVYATTLAVGNDTTSFAAGSAEVQQVEGFGAVTVDAGAPKYDPATKDYTFSDLQLTPKGDDWSAVGGKNILVTAYDSKGNEIATGEATAPAKGTTAFDVPIAVGNANAVSTWGIVIR
jgi:hypothetical protein